MTDHDFQQACEDDKDGGAPPTRSEKLRDAALNMLGIVTILSSIALGVIGVVLIAKMIGGR